MPLLLYTVSCDSCDYRKHPWAANEEEAIWGCKVEHEMSKTPKCVGQLKATTSASTPEPTSTG